MAEAEFVNKVVLITGAASGLGREAALLFAAAGASLCIIDLNEAHLEATKAAVAARGARVIALAMDISLAANCGRAVETAIRTFGRLDALCNVAGFFQIAHVEDVTQEDWNRTLGVNLTGPFFLCQAAIPHLIETQGAIVNVSSSSAFRGQAYMLPYAASKAALVSLTKSLAMEFIKQPIRINAVAPGSMRTAMAQTRSPPNIDIDLIGLASGIRPPSPPENVAEVIVFLASDRARGVHGACFNVDSGRTAL